MNGRSTRAEWLMEMAEATSKRSTCVRRHVGCVLVDSKDHVLATGYNGAPQGMMHCCDGTPWCDGKRSEPGFNLSACIATHAEMNALLQCRNVEKIHACFVTTSPCDACIKLLLNTPCSVIYFKEWYPGSEAAQNLWTMAGRSWRQI